jgi:prophage regulatory protein
MAERLLRRWDVETRVGLKRSAIYELIKRGEFPAPIKLSSGAHARASAWIEREVDDWIAARIATARGEI